MKVKSSILTAVMVAALALSVGCGDNDNSNNDNNDNGGGNPTRTATPSAPTATPTPGAPTATPTPGGGTTNVDVIFTFNSSVALQGYQVNVAYPSAKGGFEGDADNVNCTTDVPAQFVKNNQTANSTLTLVIASSSNLTFPNAIECVFLQNDGSTVADSDFVVTVVEVTQNGQAGNPADLSSVVNLSEG